MKREFRNENFEEFIKRNADNLRMKAPERVWQNLSGQLHKGRTRFGIGLSAFFLVASVLSYLTISTNNRHFRFAENPSTISAPSTPPESGKEAGTGRSAGRVALVRSPVVLDRITSLPAVPKEVFYGGVTGNPESIGKNTVSETPALLAKADFEPTVVDDYPAATDAAPSPTPTKNLLTQAVQTTASPWTIESVVNARPKQKWKERRWQTQYHFAPTISYRKLSENKSYLRNSPQALSQPNYNTLYNNVNNMVTHKPALGFELGITEKFAISQNVRIRAGVQFNVNRYDIKAFEAPLALATIALNNRRTARVDSLWTVANYSNVDVTRTNRGSWLQNYSFQMSAPVGVELTLKGSEKTQFGIAASVQPTYVLGDRTYMITSDYKSYTQVPWLLRRWNMNTAFETFVAYQSGKTRWQVGPQVRYQLLSSFISNYPVKENLFDFGLKIGISVNK